MRTRTIEEWNEIYKDFVAFVKESRDSQPLLFHDLTVEEMMHTANLKKFAKDNGYDELIIYAEELENEAMG